MPDVGTRVAFLVRTEADPSQRFTHALSVVLPELTDPQADSSRRILAAFMLHALYSEDAKNRALNPFNTALADAFVRERRRLVDPAERPTPGQSQLVWALWLIATGHGDDLAIVSPVSLATSSLPSDVQPASLQLPSESQNAADSSFISHSSSLVDPDDTFIAPTNQSKGYPGVIGRTSTNRFGAAMSPSIGVIGGRRTETAVAHKPSPSPSSLPAVDVSPAYVDSLEPAIKLISAACTRVLNLSEQRVCVLNAREFVGLVLQNAPLAAEYASLALRGETELSLPLAPGGAHFEDVRPLLDAAVSLPPTLHTFEFWGRLLRDNNPIASSGPTSGVTGLGLGTAGPSHAVNLSSTASTVSDYIRTTAELVQHVYGADDRVARGVSGVCRFYSNLIKLRLIDTSSDEQTVEMTAFALAHSSYDDARKVYRELKEASHGVAA
ncbi:hypothetical protein BKA62DRAFT_692211 [Auriculariales sp. MPI-PUGE-AT-0066]|nr:hypothetical protein BKA62DRAFT_692211 [Auriculariales sp. MPI-PUGE-AT-0066]